jgi:hypothetical protein
MERLTDVTFPQVAFVAGTRAMAGAGIGLLVSNHLRPDQRRAVGWTLLTIGIVTTIPIAWSILRSARN